MEKVLKKLLIPIVIATTLMLSGILWINISLPASAQMPPPPTPTPAPPIAMPISEPMPVDPYPFEPAPPIPEMGWCSSEPTDEGMSISGTVIDPSGEPVAKTYVQIYNLSNDYWCYDVYTDEAGAFQVYSLSAGTWNISAQANWNEDGTQHFPSPAVDVILEEGDTTVALSDPLQLTSPQATGQVLMPDGTNAVDGSVNVYALTDGETECTAPGEKDHVIDDYTIEDYTIENYMVSNYNFPYMDGTFQVGGLPIGPYCLQVMAPWSQSTLGTPSPSAFTLTEEQDGLLDLGTFQLAEPVKSIEVMVSYQQGDGTTAGLANVNVSIYSESNQGWIEGHTDESGQFTAQVGGGNWHISIHSDYGLGISPFLEEPELQMVTFAADETEESQAITFNVKVPTAGIRGRIVDADGNPVVADNAAEGDEMIAEYGSGISININSTEDWYYVSSMMNANGEFQALLPAGEYEVMIYVDSYLYPEYYAPASQTVTVDEDQIVDLGDIQLGQIDSFVTGRLVSTDGGDLPAPSTSDEVEWYDEQHYSGLSVMAYNDQLHVHREIDASGLFSLPLAPGEYKLEFHLDSMLYPGNFAPAPQTVQVVAEETVVLGDIPLQLPQIGGTITNPDGEPVAHAGFQIYGTTAEAGCSMEEWEYMGDTWFYGSADESGLFSMGGLPAGDYCLSLEQYWGMGGLFAPDPIRFTIEAGADTIALGNVSYQQPNKIIEGVVLSDNEAGEGVANVMVSASQRDGRGGWVEASTGEDGTFTLAVTGGSWDINIHPSYNNELYQSWYSEQSYQAVSFEQDQTAETKSVEFRVQVADATITGRIVGPDGEPLMMDSMNNDMEDMPYDDYHRYSAISVNAYSREGYGNSTMVGDDGTFTLQVIGGNYDVSIYVDEYMYPEYYSPEMLSVRVEDGATSDMGDITVGVKNATISGQVLDPNGAGIADIPVFGWSYNGGHGNATTDENGTYTMTVRAGDWEINTESYMDPTESAGYFLTQPAQQITVDENETATVDFAAQGVAGSILGEIVDSDGLLITDVDVQAYARRIGDVEEDGAVILAAGLQSGPIPTPAPEPYPEPFMDYDDGYYYYGYDVTAQSVSEQGRFTLEVPSGVYQVGLYLPPGSDYVFASEAATTVQDTAEASSRGQVAQVNAARTGERQVILGTTGADEDVSVKLVLLRNDSTIMGTLLDSNGEPATGIHGEVSAWMDGPGDSWQSATIDPETATYEMTVAGGTWHLDYYIDSQDYISYGAGEPLSVTVEPKGSIQQDITLRGLDSIIRGTLTDPEGNPVEWGYVWAYVEPSEELASMFFYGADAEVINGEFEMRVVSGLPYAVGTGGNDNHIQPATQVVTPSADSPSVVNLQFRIADGVISGTLTAIVDEVAQPAEYGYVHGWSDDGQSAGAEADEEGNFTFEVASGSIWHLGGSWVPNNGQAYYVTQETVTVDLTNSISGTAEIILEAEDFLMPPPMVSEFETDQSWTQALADGTRIDIPAGAIALGSTDDAPDAPTAEMPTAPEPAPVPSRPEVDEQAPTGGNDSGDAGGDAAAEENSNVKTEEARLNIMPMVEDMPCTLNACPVGYGYNVAVYDSSTGEQVISNFNEDVTMTFNYTDEEIAKANTDEDSIAPAYYSSATKNWTRIDNFTVDAKANQISAQIGHTGQWALVSSAGAAIQTPTSLDTKPEQTKYLLFLPITSK